MNHQGNADQNHKEASPHIFRIVVIKKYQITGVVKAVDKRELSCVVGRNVNWYSQAVWKFLRKVKIKLPYDTAISRLGT